ncbi:MAG: site-2 protease family protein [Candidatus Thermoplasmatota archaeon]|nr:site-2 protease family protein [Candidatus Thermoplasmatota archaeon]
MNWLLILAILIVAWIAVFYVAITRFKSHFAPYGPALLIKTQVGVRTIERVSKHKFWDHFVSFFYYAMPFLATGGVALLIWEAVLVLSIPKGAAPSLSYYLALPGINPALPITWGIIGLIIAVALHEAAHGIAARRFGIPVRSTGLLWLIIPIGAFVEPDEEEMKKVEPKTRAKVFAAGPGMNITLTVIFLVLAILMAYSFAPVPGSPVQSSLSTTPEFQPGDILQSVGGVSVTNDSVLTNLSFTPGSQVNVTLLRSGHLITESVVYGIYVTDVLKNYPAYDAGITPGSVIVSMGNHTITNYTAFTKAESSYVAGQTVAVETFNGTSYNSYNVTLASRYSYLLSSGVSNPGISKDYPFMGVDVSVFGLILFDQYSYLSILKNPTSGGALGFFEYLGLPFHSEFPLPASLQLSINSNPVSLNLEYLFYWLFWLNFALGLMNLLPIVPLDGGYVFLNTPLLQKNKKARDAIVAAVSLFVLFLILWEVIIPHII